MCRTTEIPVTISPRDTQHVPYRLYYYDSVRAGTLSDEQSGGRERFNAHSARVDTRVVNAVTYARADHIKLTMTYTCRSDNVFGPAKRGKELCIVSQKAAQLATRYRPIACRIVCSLFASYPFKRAVKIETLTRRTFFFVFRFPFDSSRARDSRPYRKTNALVSRAVVIIVITAYTDVYRSRARPIRHSNVKDKLITIRSPRVW